MLLNLNAGSLVIILGFQPPEGLNGPLATVYQTRRPAGPPARSATAPQLPIGGEFQG